MFVGLRFRIVCTIPKHTIWKIGTFLVNGEMQNPKEMSTQIGIDIGFGSHYVVRVNSPAEGSTEPVIELVPNESKEVENR